MFRNILLPLDLTDRHHQALDISAELAGGGAAAITLLHAIETIAGLSPAEERDFYGRLERAARSHLDRWRKDLEKRKFSCQMEIRYGNRAAECVRYALENGVDLIILTAPRIDPSNPAGGLGSMSYKIGILSPCPVLLVK
jgi:nucleotide-binding universal stress UspA family protein